MDAGFDRFCLALGRRMRELRLRRGMTQEDMLDHGFGVRHYQRLEAGHSITLAAIWKVARVFRVHPREILLAVEDQRGRSARQPRRKSIVPRRGS